MENKKDYSQYIIPGLVVLSIILLAGAVFYAGAMIKKYYKPPSLPVGSLGSSLAENVQPVTGSDHIRGSADASIVIIEFSDPECPFCRRLHPSLKQIFEEYNGRVAWVYRHFPLDAIHRKARREAAGLECAGELGGNEKFWKYLDRLFEITPSNDLLDTAELPRIAGYVGLDREVFEECLASGKFADHIEKDLQDAVSSGGSGTPYMVIIAPNNKKMGLSGAQPYETIRQVVEILLP